MSRNVKVPPQISLRFGEDFTAVSGKNLIYHCIFCEEKGNTPDTSGKLYIHTEKLVYHCFRCGSKGSVQTAVKGYHLDKVYTNSDIVEALEGILKKEDNSSRVDLIYSIPKLKPYANPEAYNYLVNRGITPSMMDRYNIRVGSVVSKYKDRIIIPNIVSEDEDGNDVTDMFVARYIKEVPKDIFTGRPLFGKYLNPFGENKSKSVFNLHNIDKGKPVIITEGVFSALSAGPSAVATYGKYVSDIQLKRILNNKPREIYVALDSDAYPEAVKLCHRIKRWSPYTIVKLVRMPDGVDPSDTGFVEFMKILKKSELFDKSSNLILEILEDK